MMHVERKQPLLSRSVWAHPDRSRLVDMVAFGRPIIANPNLPARFAVDAPLAEINWPKVHDPTAAGYTDYPTFDALTA
jgi:N-ethylmaleimide reductase